MIAASNVKVYYLGHYFWSESHFLVYFAAIPKPTMSIPDDPYEKYTSYRDQFCEKTDTTDTEGNKLPDIQPMNKAKFKYHHNSKFSYNSRQNNMAY